MRANARSRSCIRAHLAFIQPADFPTETFLTYSPIEESTVYQRLLAPAGVVPARTLQVRLTEAIIEMARAGMGIGALSAWAVAPHVAAGTVVTRPLTRRRFGRTWRAATLRQAARLPHVRDFVALLQAARPFAALSPPRPPQISTCDPSSITWLVGRRK